MRSALGRELGDRDHTLCACAAVAGRILAGFLPGDPHITAGLPNISSVLPQIRPREQFGTRMLFAGVSRA
jgi:hypothetical protein